jgi:nucleotide-binding universal stress UspA family protein
MTAASSMSMSPGGEGRCREPREATGSSRAQTVTRVAVGVDGYPEGRDAAALGAAIARITGAELMLVAVYSTPLVPAPPGLDWKGLRSESQRILRSTRDAVAPAARTLIETDLSIARGLHRVVQRHHRDLLVVGSSRHGPEGRVRIGKRTRQLLCHFECALAVAPRGLHARRPVRIRRIGVGFDRSPESAAGLALAGSIAAAASGVLRVCGVVDDRAGALAWNALGGILGVEWEDLIRNELEQLRVDALDATRGIGAEVRIEVARGRPADALLALSEDVDLLVVGSRRWGPTARLLLGSTGEAVLHDAGCAVVTVPRAPTDAGDRE